MSDELVDNTGTLDDDECFDCGSKIIDGQCSWSDCESHLTPEKIQEMEDVLNRIGYKDYVITHQYPEYEGNHLNNNGSFVMRWTKLKGIDSVLHFPFGDKMLNTKKWWRLIKYIGRVLNELKLHRIETAYVHWLIPLAPLIVGNANKVVAICHGSDIYWLKKHPFIAAVLKNAISKIDFFYFVSWSLKREFQSIYPDLHFSFKVEHMPIDEELFKQYSDNRIRRNDVKFMCTCGNLIPRKRMDLVLKYFKSKKHLFNRLYIIGSGLEYTKLSSLAFDLGIHDKIAFMGEQRPEQVAEIFGFCHEFVLFSEDEGLGLVIKEAKLAGCETVVTPGDGKEEISDRIVSKEFLEFL